MCRTKNITPEEGTIYLSYSDQKFKIPLEKYEDGVSHEKTASNTKLKAKYQ